jgi:hypothetical protein
MSTAEDIVRRGNNEDKIETIKEGISNTLPVILQDYEYETDNIEGIERALFKECCRTMVQHSERLGTSMEKQVTKVAEDFEDSPNTHAKSDIMVFLGSLSGCNGLELEDTTQEDIMRISGKILEDKYGQE